MDDPYILCAGCSHTDISLSYIDQDEFWINQVGKTLNCKVVNLAKAGACASYVGQQIKNWLAIASTQPTLVIAQWPNPFRSLELRNGKVLFSNVNSPSAAFSERLRSNPDSFWQEWKESIIGLKSACSIPLINICLESTDFIGSHIQDLSDKNIVLHIDEKKPGKTWHFDSAGKDRLHHSAECHTKWATRVLTIINETL